MFVKGISSIRKINKVIAPGRERSSIHFRKKTAKKNSKDIDFPISKEFGNEKKKNEEAENVATHLTVSGDRTWKRKDSS